MTRNYLSPLDISPDERRWILGRARELKRGARRERPLDARVGALFFNPSLRTRVSWEQAARLLGCEVQTLNAGSDMWTMEMDPLAVMDQNTSECVVEGAGVLGRFFHLLGIRAFPTGRPWEEEKLEPVHRAFIQHSGTRIVSLEGAMHHPCQGLADHLTLQEQFGETRGRKVVLQWGWHIRALPMAVPNTFALQSALAGCDLTIIRPEGYDLDPGLMGQIESSASEAGGSVKVTDDLYGGLEGAEAVYVKAWGRLERPGEAPDPSLRHWMMDEEAWRHTAEAKVMHCLPTRRNVEIASSILDSPRSIVLEEAENRLWAQAGLIEFLLTEGDSRS